MFGFIKKKLGLEAKESLKVRESIDRDELEDLLLEADVNYELVERVLEQLPQNINRTQLYNSLVSIFDYKANWIDYRSKQPFVEMIIGVNGAGKTTTIAKLASRYKSEGSRVLLGAADTFRAAAIEQLSRWAAKLDIPIVATKQGHDPSAVVFDAISSAKAKGIDNVLIDTAGRLHTQVNLGNELQKMVRVANKAIEGAPHRKLLIIDGTQGSSAINQALAFNEMVGIDGIIITKLDGTAKGGSILSIADELQMPIYYIGIGEKAEDLMKFDIKWYINSILDEIFTVEE
ncbi:MAG TPA: signal recognition particle-docking protein FtsY [Nitratifractor sp.]|nr:signal recognition particle-docking protein FtsY [Nitratifractor sp.]HHH21038.1 signal recognition particle-docking protein FtsY [Nitratifractor sp.]